METRKRFKVTYPQTTDYGEVSLGQYYIFNVPRFVIIDREGRIVEISSRHEGLEETIKTLL